MLQRLMSVGRFGSGGTGKSSQFRQEQVAHITNWAYIPDNQLTMAALHRIHVVPYGASTVTYVNPIDPDPDYEGWRVPVQTGGRVHQHGNMVGQ